MERGKMCSYWNFYRNIYLPIENIKKQNQLKKLNKKNSVNPFLNLILNVNFEFFKLADT